MSFDSREALGGAHYQQQHKSSWKGRASLRHHFAITASSGAAEQSIALTSDAALLPVLGRGSRGGPWGLRTLPMTVGVMSLNNNPLSRVLLPPIVVTFAPLLLSLAATSLAFLSSRCLGFRLICHMPAFRWTCALKPFMSSSTPS